MADSATVRKVRELAQPLCDELGLFLWDVKFEKDGANWFLRVFIDSDEGITLDDCEALHRPLDKLLDEYDPIPQSYILEVSSPGLGRKLERPEHFEVCVGDRVKLRFFEPKNGSKEKSGVLEEYSGQEITVSGEKIKLSECASVRLDDDSDISVTEND